MNINIPDDLRYTKTHEWVRVDGNIGTVGITEFAVKEINEIIFIELPKIGSEVSLNSPFGSIESVKAVFDLFSPVSGVVKEVNTNLSNNPEIISKSPYEDGWIMKIELSTEQKLDLLMDSKKYSEHVDKEASQH